MPVAPEADPAFPGLTRREYEVLQLLTQGRSSRDIASRLFVSEKTMRNHLSLIFDKLDAGCRAEAIVLTHRHGID